MSTGQGGGPSKVEGVDPSLLIDVIACARTHAGDGSIRATLYTLYKPDRGADEKAAENSAGPRGSSPKKIPTAPDAWQSIVALLADAPAESVRILALRARWTGSSRTHRIAGSGTAGEWRAAKATAVRGSIGGLDASRAEDPRQQTTLADGMSVEPTSKPVDTGIEPLSRAQPSRPDGSHLL